MSATQRSAESMTSSNVIPIAAYGSASSESVANIGKPPVADEATDAQIKTWIESAVMQAYLAAKAEQREEHDGPFDPIYIAALRPDPVDFVAVGQLQKFRHIEDKSDELFLDDGMDD